MGALKVMSVVSGLKLGLNKEFFTTYLNSCPPWKPWLLGTCQGEASSLCPLRTNAGAGWGEGSPTLVSQLLVNESGPTRSLSSDADYFRAQLALTIFKTCPSTWYSSKYPVSSLPRKEMLRQPWVCVCMYMAASSEERNSLPGIGNEWRLTWLQAAFNYREPHFKEVLPKAL